MPSVTVDLFSRMEGPVALSLVGRGRGAVNSAFGVREDQQRGSSQ